MVKASKAPASVHAPCSREQEGLWLLEQRHDIGAANNLPVAADIAGDLDLDTLEEALAHLVASEPSLHTELAVVDGRLVRRELAAPQPSPRIDVVHVADEHEATTVVAERASRVLDPLAWPPFEATLITRPDDRFLLLIVLHHCVFDGSSAEPLLDALGAHYETVANGGPRPERIKTPSFDAFVHEEQRLIDQLDDRARDYWTPRLAAVADSQRLPSAPADRCDQRDAAVVEFRIPEDVKLGLQRVGERHGASVFVTLLAALQAVQWRWTGAGDDGVATAIAMDARPRGQRRAIGMYANEAPLLSVPRNEQAFGELLGEVNDASRALFALRRYPFTEALARFAPTSARREFAAEFGITFLRLRRSIDSPPAVEIRPLGVLANRSSRRALMLWVFDEPDGMRCRLEGDANAVDTPIVQGISRHFTRMLDAVAADVHVQHASVPAVDRAAETELVKRWSCTGPAQLPESSVAVMVERQTRIHPEAIAVESNGRRFSYAELDQRASELARRLRGLGAGPDVPVAISLQRSAGTVVAMLGVLKAGAAYMPLDPSYPPDRLQVMLEKAAPPIVVTERGVVDALPSTRAHLLLLDGDDDEQFRDEPSGPPARSPRLDDLAYVIFTSGSTGVPKAVAMPQRPLINLLAWQIDRFVLKGPARTLHFASASFDVSFQEIFSTLVTGGTIIVVDEESRRDMDLLARLIRDAGVDRLFVPFLVLSGLARAVQRYDGLPRELEVITAGEQLEITPDIREMFGVHPGWTLVNQYGPTETHVVTEHRLESGSKQWPTLPPIGRPITGARVFVLDQQRRVVPVGVEGQLYVGGVALARGYLGEPRLTSDRFVESPFDPPGARLYRTGDLVRWRRDGVLEFVGRADEQVKIRGYRVEPGEVRARLMEHSRVREAAVVAREDAIAGRRLVAYVVPATEVAPTPRELRHHVAAALPDFMVPNAFVALDSVPTTPNGKLDRHRLPAPPAGPEGAEYVPPRTRMEAAIADVWASALGLGRVGVDDDFFRLGGHSLLAGEVIARTREALGRNVPLRMLFANPTVAGLAAALQADAGTQGVDAPIPRAERRRVGDRAM